MQKSKLWYRQPAVQWTDSLPLGNGRIGAMVFGGVSKERIALNEDSLWSGYPQDKNNPDAAKHLAHARELANAGKLEELAGFIEENMLAEYSESYLPLGDIYLEFPDFCEKDITEYYRDLDLNEAIAHTRFTCGGIRMHREAFVTCPGEAFVMKLWTETEGALCFRVSFDSQLRTEATAEVSEKGNHLCINGLCPSHVEPSYLYSENPVIYEEDPEKKGIRFCGDVEVRTVGGSVKKAGNALEIEGATEAIVLFRVRSSFNGFDRQPWLDGRDCETDLRNDLQLLMQGDYETWRELHVEDHRKLFERVDFYLEKEEEELPTDERLVRFLEKKDDKELYQLLFQYGRYLLIAGSRPGTHPANLQGIWNQDLRAPWSGNYTLNINAEMNYWPAEICNLSECHEPLLRFIQDLRVNGAKTARVHYGANGVCSHHNSDIWCITNPMGRKDKGSVGYAYWCMSFGWLCQHLYTHYEYTKDLAFLKDSVYPALCEAVKFYLDMLTPDGDGHLILSPSTSPENGYLLNGVIVKVAKTTTMTTAIMKEVFEHCLKCSEELKKAGVLTDGQDAELLEKIKEAKAKLQPYKIGSFGQFQEWDQDYEDAEATHRHISHLYPLYPGNEISLRKTPELAEACKQTLLIRGDDGTGWSLGWKINTWARLGDGNHAEILLKRQLNFVDTDELNYSNGGGTYRNLFDAHPPFQIDGNFAATAGIAEMLLQNEDGVIVLLPALPDAWKTGYMKGLRAKGGMEVDIYFTDGKLSKAVLCNCGEQSAEVKVRYGEKIISRVLESGQDWVVEDMSIQI